MSVRVRFAPSPTGSIHLGNVRTALFNYLFVKSQKDDDAKFILRIEDTDLSRSTKEYEEYIFRELKWLGITWNEGMEVGGDYGPYRQTERLELYNQYAKKLIESGDAYHCYCSQEELSAMREIHPEKAGANGYDGRCRNLTVAEKEAFEQEGRKPVLRFRVPENKAVTFNDLIKGEITVESETITDFVMVRPDGIPTYNYACVIDDTTMDITDVIRGEDHISNTPKQILIYRALGLKEPRYGHPSMILGPDRTKLSKRHGSNYVGQYRDKGYLPEALFNFMALMGWSPDGEEEILSKEELENMFSMDKVAKNPAVFDIDKLNWMNGGDIRQRTPESLVDLVKAQLIEGGVVGEDVQGDQVLLITKAFQEKVKYLQEMVEMARPLLSDTLIVENDEAMAMLQLPHVEEMLKTMKEMILEREELTPDTVGAFLKEVGQKTGQKGKNLFMCVRVALTGQMHGPEMNYIFPILKKEGVLSRIEQALTKS